MDTHTLLVGENPKSIKIENESENAQNENDYGYCEIKVEPMDLPNEVLENTIILIPDQELCGKVKVIKKEPSTNIIENTNSLIPELYGKVKIIKEEPSSEIIENTNSPIPDQELCEKVKIIQKESNSEIFEKRPLSRRDVFQHMCNLKIYPDTKARSLL